MKTGFLALLVVFASGCGYSLRGNTRPFFDEHGIHNLYIEPIKNNSYKAGVESTVYNALRKRIMTENYVRIVDKEDLADAKFSAAVTDASYVPGAIVTGDQIQTGNPQNPTRPELGNVQIAKSYNVNLSVSFQLTQLHPTKKNLWSDTIARQKTFPSTVYLGPLGSTSALINESDYERALSELAGDLVVDAEESVNTIF